jgi:predicted phosphoserine aminotransferase
MVKLFIPGPVDVHPEVLAAQAQPMMAHRSAEFESIFHGAANKMRSLFGTESRVFITASSGTGLQEAVVRNLVKKRMLSCVNGAFGARWHQVAQDNGKEANKLEVDWDQPVAGDVVAEVVKDRGYEIVTVVHNETSTGLMNPINEVAGAVKEVSPNTIVCVDAVSSLGGVEVQMDAWGLDVVLTSSQKCLALPPGLGFAAVSDRALARAEEVPERGWYFDFLRLEKHRLKNSTPATSAVSLIYALALQLDRIMEEGLANRFARHADMAQRVQEWALEQGFDLFAPEGYRSKTMTAIENRLEVEVGEMNAFLQEKGMRIANGYGPMKNKTFRIGHMGETQLEDLDVLLKALDEYLATR